MNRKILKIFIFTGAGFFVFLCLLTAIVIVFNKKTVPQEEITDEFKKPVQVQIKGYKDDAMEPFISRDGKYLFFNNLNDPSVNTNIHYAKKIDDNTFEYMGEVGGVNTSSLEGVPTMDMEGNFFFISVRSYEETFCTLYSGVFKDGAVNNVNLLEGNISRKKAPWFNMDVEISPDGETLYYTENKFNLLLRFPDTSDFKYAVKKEDKFIEAEDSSEIMKNINTDDMEYAASISEDGLELFFTRATLQTALVIVTGADMRILTAKRKDVNEPFEVPQKISVIEGFAEAPSITSDGKILYYHKKTDGRFYIYKITRD